MTPRKKGTYLAQSKTIYSMKLSNLVEGDKILPQLYFLIIRSTHGKNTKSPVFSLLEDNRGETPLL